MASSQTMITAADLHSLLQAQSVTVLDASWYLPSEARDPRDEFLKAHIPGAQFFDIDQIADAQHSCPHMLPSESVFESAMERLGVNRDADVVIYDGNGLFSAPRAWWMFRVFGHERVRILEKGMPGWIAEGFSTESGVTREKTVDDRFIATLQPDWLADINAVNTALADNAAIVLDARSATRFAGEEPEPRQGVRPGHIPGSSNLHYASLLTGKPSQFRGLDELAALFQTAGCDGMRTIVTTCGSGISACILALALHELGKSPVAVYDGSWAEWGSRADCPVERG
jgi:thiosulfate/3-mercaptopyruvate sulfurtransferase